MSVYVDPLRDWGGSKGFRWKTSCHMYADTDEELHTMALAIGMKKTWFQGDPRLPHYDLRPERRVAAVAAGAVEHTRSEMKAVMRHRRFLRELIGDEPVWATSGTISDQGPITLEKLAEGLKAMKEFHKSGALLPERPLFFHPQDFPIKWPEVKLPIGPGPDDPLPILNFGLLMSPYPRKKNLDEGND